ARDAGEDEAPDRVLQHGAVAGGENVVDIGCEVGAAGAEGEVAEAACRLDDELGSPFQPVAVVPGEPLVAEEPFQLRLDHGLTGDQVYLGLADDGGSGGTVAVDGRLHGGLL